MAFTPAVQKEMVHQGGRPSESVVHVDGEYIKNIHVEIMYKHRHEDEPA